MYSPNREKLFEDIEQSDECASVSCSCLRHHKGEPHCVAMAHGECARVNVMASEINQFIADNDDVFMYIKPVNE